MRRRLVVTVLLDEGEHEDLYKRLAGLVCSMGVAAWQIDRRFGEEETFGHDPRQGPVDVAVRELDLVVAR
jgi:hypothetical protein